MLERTRNGVFIVKNSVKNVVKFISSIRDFSSEGTISYEFNIPSLHYVFSIFGKSFQRFCDCSGTIFRLKRFDFIPKYFRKNLEDYLKDTRTKISKLVLPKTDLFPVE